MTLIYPPSGPFDWRGLVTGRYARCPNVCYRRRRRPSRGRYPERIASGVEQGDRPRTSADPVRLGADLDDRGFGSCRRPDNHADRWPGSSSGCSRSRWRAVRWRTPPSHSRRIARTRPDIRGRDRRRVRGYVHRNGQRNCYWSDPGPPTWPVARPPARRLAGRPGRRPEASSRAAFSPPPSSTTRSAWSAAGPPALGAGVGAGVQRPRTGRRSAGQGAADHGQ